MKEEHDKVLKSSNSTQEVLKQIETLENKNMTLNHDCNELKSKLNNADAQLSVTIDALEQLKIN